MIMALNPGIASKLSLAAVAAPSPLHGQLAHLTPLDVAVIAIYFAMVLFIGFYLRQASSTSEQFFLAGREMTAWIAGPEFRERQHGLAGTDGLGWVRLSIRHSGHALVLDRRHPGDAVSRPGDDAVLLRLEDTFRTRLFEVAFWRIEPHCRRLFLRD